MEKVLSVALIDDHVLFRNGFKMLLENLTTIKVVAEGCNGQEFLDIIAEKSIDLVFLDIAMPIMDGCIAAKKAISLQPDIKIIMLSMYGDESYYSRLFETGVKGFLLKSSEFSEVTMSISTVAGGGTYISQELMTNMVHKIGNGAQRKGTISGLSDRELEVLIEVCNGLSAVEIAEKYFISKRTIEKHKANILLKTNCKNTASLVVYAINNQLITV